MFAVAVTFAVRLRDDEEESEDNEDETKNAPNQSQQVGDQNEESRPDTTEKSRFETREYLSSGCEEMRKRETVAIS